MRRPSCCWLLTLLLAVPALAEEGAGARPAAHLSAFGAGAGPVYDDGVYRLLDAARTPLQANAAGFDLAHEGAHESFALSCRLRVLEGGDGGSFLFLSTQAYGRRGPAPFLPSAVEPNLKGSFAVGIDVHNPPSREMFTPWGNYQDLPQREVSLHLDGRELVKRVAPAEFRGDFAPVRIEVQHVAGGAEVTVEIQGERVYDREFVANLQPYELRLGLAAGTRADATTLFDVAEPRLEVGAPAAPRRPPLHVEVFNHVLTDNTTTSYAQEVSLPPLDWAFARVLLTLDIHDAGAAWDEWDRNGEVSILDDEGVKLGIVPFITSYRTECHWVVDVTHFRPLLAGKRRIEIAAGTTFYKNRGYMMSLSLDFHHGTPALEPYRVVPIWVGTARYRSAENHFQDFFEPRTVSIDAEARGARLFVTTTGHSQVGEFTPSRRTIRFTPDVAAADPVETMFENVLWKTDVYLNPNRPQFGTWQFSRAGWAPGDVVRPWWIDLTPDLEPGKEARLSYRPEPYDFSGEEQQPTEAQVNEASHVVRAYLILYREPTALVAAPVLFVGGVEDGSNAAKAGIRAGDYLAEYDGTRLDSVDDLRAAIARAAAAGKEDVPVVVFRGSDRLEVRLPPGRMGVNLGSR